MNITTIVVGSYQVNCYILSFDGENAVVIDPGFEADKINATLGKQRLKARLIINTHGHADHIGANRDLAVPVWIGAEDAAFLTDPELNLSAFFASPITSPAAERTLQDGEKCTACGMHFTVLHTPGHTPGGICLLFDDAVFSGDTLFQTSIGRTDFPHSDGRKIIPAIKKKLMVLDDAITVYPGHGPRTTIGFEREHNYFLR
jgi:glyoxylase-like metal-dependent hydrolase (beta-lactamase superfamily II)